MDKGENPRADTSCEGKIRNGLHPSGFILSHSRRRISHLKGLLASLLGIKPIIRVDKVSGKYAELSKHRTFSRAIDGLANYAATKFGKGSHLRVQIGHAGNPDAAVQLREKMEGLFNCDWLPNCSISPVLGAHTGRGLIGMVFALAETFRHCPDPHKRSDAQ